MEFNHDFYFDSTGHFLIATSIWRCFRKFSIGFISLYCVYLYRTVVFEVMRNLIVVGIIC
jgi:hypothetical protein